MTFDKSIHFYNHQSDQYKEHFHYPREVSLCLPEEALICITID